jgi:pyruvate/2-oxoglutarate dehydrogenase complex dihydrolipoamide dehydrogenase (E3) component
MVERLNVDICVIGAGSGGLSVAAGAAMLGVPVALIERGRMGGDCLNYGCVPSKALIAAAKSAETARRSARFGLSMPEPEVDWARVSGHVHGVIADIAPHDSAARFRGLGVHVIAAEARFTGPTQVTAGEITINARRVVVATGSSPLVPPVPGLAEVPYLTNETIFELEQRPEHLIVMGGGPIGLELAQAHRRLGARVTVIEMFQALGRDDPELARIVVTRLRREGIEVLEETQITGVERTASGIAVDAEGGAGTRRIEGSHLLVAAGRRANTEGLDLEVAGIRVTPQGIDVDNRLRTSNRKVYAVGDVAGGLQFTHVAGHHAGIVVRNALFRLPAKYDANRIPRVTYTDPEFAHVGLGEAEARAARGEIRVLRWPFAENDRARAERDVDGLVKVVTDRRGRILGASIVGSHAGEIIQPWVLALTKGMKVGDVTGLVAPYPTYGEANVRAASSYFAPTLFSPRTRRIVRLLTRLG